MTKDNGKMAMGKDQSSLNTESSNLNLNKSHKDWYNRSEMGKQLGKPKYSPPKVKKAKKK